LEKNITKSNIPKTLYANIIKLAATKTKINIELIQKLDDSGLHFLFTNEKDATDFENNIGKYIIKSIKEYMLDNSIDKSLYLMNLLFTTTKANIVVNIYW